MKYFKIKPDTPLAFYLSEAGGLGTMSLVAITDTPGRGRPDRVEIFLRKIKAGEPFEFTDGTQAALDKRKNKSFIDALSITQPNGEYARDKAAVDAAIKQQGGIFTTDGNAVRLTSFVKTPELGGGGGINVGTKGTTSNEIGQALVLGVMLLSKKSKLTPADLSLDKLQQVATSGIVQPTNEAQAAVQEVADKVVNDPAWTKSFINTAAALVDFGIPTKGVQIWRGGAWVKQLNKTFSTVNKLERPRPFDSKDKWNPSDIWIVKNNTPVPDVNSLKELNDWLLNQLYSKTVVGISLKKTTTASPHVSVYNLDPLKNQIKATVQQLIASRDHKVESIFDTKYTRIKVKESINIPLSLHYMLAEKDTEVQYRTLKTGSDIAGQIQGAEAAHGNLGFSGINRILEKITKRSLTFRHVLESRLNNPEQKREVILEMARMAAPMVGTFKLDAATQGKLFTIANNSPIETLVSKYQALQLLSILSENRGTKADKFLQEFLLTAGSQSAQSSVFLKVS